MKRSCDIVEEDQAEEDSTEDAEAKSRKVMFATYQKWRRDFDIELTTVTWLSCETEISAGKVYVKRLKCSICTRYNSKIIGRRNFSDRWITGADYLRTSNMPRVINTSMQCRYYTKRKQLL